MIDVSRLLFIFLPPALLVGGTLVVLTRFRQAETRLLRRTAAVFGVWAGVAVLVLVATNFGSAFETIEVRNDSSRIVGVGGHYEGDRTLAPGAIDEVGGVNGIEDVHIILPDGRTITFRFSGKKRGESNVLTIRDAAPANLE